MFQRAILIFIFISIFFGPVYCQNQKYQRPKVGLALSGGAAHGLAHIGVIKYLEELEIEVDYITGTSMGSIIGGMYAMGFGAEEIAKVASAQDWNLLMSNHTPLYEVSPIEKKFHEKIPLSIFWKNEAFRLPQGFIRGQKLDLIISKIYYPAYFIDDFDDLYIPFRCVATDIEDGSIDVLDCGYLGESIRASMAIPTVFTPKEINNTLYVDGGLIRNFPVQEVKDLGADFVIGVYVGSVRKEKKDLHSMLDVLRQSASMGNILDSDIQNKLADIVIHPEVKDMNTFGFEQAEQFIDLGYNAARKHDKELKELAERLKKFPSPQRGERLSFPKSVEVKEIFTSETDPVVHKMIVNRLKFKEGDRVNLSTLEESLSLVYGTKNFSKSSYSFDVLEDGIALQIDTEPIDPFNIGISLNRFKNYNASLILTGEARNLIGKLSNLRIDTRISENPGIQANYHIRIPSSPSYVFKLTSKYEKYKQPFFNNNRVDRLYNYNISMINASINKEWKNRYVFYFGYTFKYEFLKAVIFKANDFRQYRTSKHQLELGLSHNSLDRTVFPEKGMYFSFDAGFVLSNDAERQNQSDLTTFLNFEEDNQYSFMDLDFSYFLHSTTLLCSEIYIKGRYGTGKSFLDHYKIGGPLQEKKFVYGFNGIDDSELILGNHISAKYALRFHISSSIYLSPVIQYIYGEDYLSYAFERERYVSTFGYGINMGLDSPIGPIVMDIGYSGMRDSPIINLGFGFRHIF